MVHLRIVSSCTPVEKAVASGEGKPHSLNFFESSHQLSQVKIQTTTIKSSLRYQAIPIFLTESGQVLQIISEARQQKKIKFRFFTYEYLLLNSYAFDAFDLELSLQLKLRSS